MNRRIKIVKMYKYTDFGILVKCKLLQIGKDQKWLQEEITSRTGLFVDGSYMYKVLKGQRNAPRIVAAIREILDIPQETIEEDQTTEVI
jgi:hypothetical protein